MLKLTDGIVELYRKVATSLPPDVEAALKEAFQKEDNSFISKDSLNVILENIIIARKTLTPLCQDTGVPIFFVHVPVGISQKEIREAITDATRISTKIIPLRPNAVDVLTGKNTGDNTGDGFPIIYFEETDKDTLRVDLMLKGGGSENVGMTYKLPDDNLHAQRNLEGVRKCVIDAIFRAQGRGCPPYTIGIGIGATKDQVAVLSKKQLLRKVNDTNPVEPFDDLEKDLLQDINSLGIGPVGFGGMNTALCVKIGSNHRHPASYFVDVSVSCWANRRGALLW